MGTARAKVVLDLKTSNFQKGLKKAHSSWKSFSASILNVKTMFAGALAGVGLSKMISMSGELIDLARTQQEAEAGLAQALKQKGAFTHAAMEDLTKYASGLQAVTTTGDEATIAIMRQLVQYGIMGDELKMATKLTLDMAASGKEATGAADLIGKAFKGEFGTLSRYGIILDKTIPKSEKFNAALAEMNRMFGGQAEALADIDANKLKQMGNVWGDIKESLGMGLATGIAETAQAAFGAAQGISEWNDANKDLMESGVAEVIRDIAGALGLVAATAQGAAAALSLVLTPLKPIMTGWDLVVGYAEGDVGAQFKDRYVGFLDTFESSGKSFEFTNRMWNRPKDFTEEFLGTPGATAWPEAVTGALRNLTNDIKRLEADAASAGG